MLPGCHDATESEGVQELRTMLQIWTFLECAKHALPSQTGNERTALHPAHLPMLCKPCNALHKYNVHTSAHFCTMPCTPANAPHTLQCLRGMLQVLNRAHRGDDAHGRPGELQPQRDPVEHSAW